MARLRKPIGVERRGAARSRRLRTVGGQLAIYAALSALLLGLVALADDAPFRRFSGGIDPVVATAAVLLLGGAALAPLLASGAFAVYRPLPLRRFAAIAGAAAGFGAVVVTADLLLGYPADINVALPQALLFYPVIGFVAQTVFQRIPLALLLPLARRVVPTGDAARASWLPIPLIASFEAVFQVLLAGGGSFALAAFTAVHLYLFTLVELELFRRQDLVASYAFRLVYYAIWHLLWGHLRLSLLF